MNVIKLFVLSIVILLTNQVFSQDREIDSGSAENKPVSRTEQEVKDFIAQEGKKPPLWWSEVKLDYPATLDLDIPDYVPGVEWNNQRYVRAYVREIIKPNPHRWRSGIKLYHKIVLRHKDNVEKRTIAMQRLGYTFFHFEQDYLHAAYWWQHAKVNEETPYYYTFLAECYWKLGNKSMAMEAINKIKDHPPVIKLLADMGETAQALQLSEKLAQTDPTLGYYYAGDTCRFAGRHKEALAYYQKAIAARHVLPERDVRFQKRAEENVLALKAFELLDLKKVPDGTYKNESMGYEAPIQIEVVVKSGIITEVKVTHHREKQFFSSITDTCRQIKEKQGVNGVDATSGATMTSEAILNATAKALAGAMN